MAFLEACVDGTSLRFSTAPRAKIAVDSFSELRRLGVFARSLRVLGRVEGWNPDAVQLHDVYDGETMTTVSWFAAASDQLGLAGIRMMRSKAGPDLLVRKAAHWCVPVVANTTRASVTGWFETVGDVLFDGDEVWGFDARTVTACRLEIGARADKDTDLPEMVFQPSVAVIAMTPDGPAQTRSALDGWAVQWRLLDPASSESV